MRKKLIIIPAVLFLTLYMTFGQSGTLSPQWLINSSGEKWDVLTDLLVLPDSTEIFGGNYTQSSVITGKTGKLTGTENAFVIKSDNTGKELWHTSLTSTGYTYLSAMALDGNGDIWVCGTFTGKLTVDAVSSDSSLSKSLFILKLNDKGKPVFLNRIEGNFSNGNICITINKTNMPVVAASFKGDITVNKTVYSAKYYFDIIMLGTDQNGKIVKTKVIGGDNDQMVNDIVCNASGNILLTGYFEDNLKIGKFYMKTRGGKDCFLVKTSDNLEPEYVGQIGGIYDDFGKDLTIDNLGNTILAGSFAGELKLSTGDVLKSEGVKDVFLLKYDGNENLVWARSFGGKANEFASSVTVNEYGNIYLSGNFRGKMENGNKKTASEDFSNDIFLVKYTDKGELRMIESAGDTNVDYAGKLIAGKDGYIYFTGNFGKTSKLFDLQTKQAVDEDFFIAKLYDCDNNPGVELPPDTNVCGQEITLTVDEGYEKYFWNDMPGTNEFTIDTSGIYTVATVDEHGCVSGDTIEVNIYPVPVFDLGDTIYAVKGETVTLYGPEGMENYLWSDGSTLSFLNVNTALLEAGSHIYTVEVESENSCMLADSINVYVTENQNTAFDINHLNQNEKIFLNSGKDDIYINIFPNPTKNILTVEILNSKDTEFSLFLETLEGKTVLQSKLNATSEHYLKKINISNIETGTYLFNMRSKNITFIQRIIIL